MDMQTIDWVTKALVIFTFVSFTFVFAERIITKKGIGARTIQLTGLLLIVPLIGILAMHGILEK